MRRKSLMTQLRLVFAICVIGMLFVARGASALPSEERRDVMDRLGAQFDRIVKLIKKHLTPITFEDYPIPPKPKP